MRHADVPKKGNLPRLKLRKADSGGWTVPKPIQSVERMKIDLAAEPIKGRDCAKTDLREQLFNEGLTGAVETIQVSAARISQVRGLLFDIDPCLLKSNGALGNLPKSPMEFYELVIKPMLSRHTVLTKAQVRNSGTGLHVILRFDDPYQCDSDAARDDIARVSEIVRCLLPIDPMQPGITGLTRPLGSINTKNGAVVELLAPGEPVTYSDVRELATRVVASPFATICDVLLGGDRISPCPSCRQADTTMTVLAHVGMCYRCGKIPLQQLWDAMYVPQKEAKEVISG